MSVQISSRVWKESDKKGGQLLLLLALADMANSHGFCWPSAGTLAEMTRMSERHVARMYNQLARAGDLYIQPRDGRSNYFVVLVGMSREEFVGTAVEHLGKSRQDAENIWTKLQIHRAKWASGPVDEEGGEDDEGHSPGSNGAAPAAQPPALDEDDEGDCECDHDHGHNDDEGEIPAVYAANGANDPRQNVTPQATPDKMSPPLATLGTPDKMSPRQNVTPDIAMSDPPDTAMSGDPSLTYKEIMAIPEDFDSSSLWVQALEELELQMTNGMFTTHLLKSWCEGHEGNTLKIVVDKQTTAEVITHHPAFAAVISRTLSALSGYNLTIQARVEEPAERVQRLRSLSSHKVAVYAGAH